MTLEEFLEDFNGAAYEHDEIARLAVDVSDNEDFSQAAEEFLLAKDEFEEQLANAGFMFG